MNEDRPIEKLLRRYARKRRDDAGPPVELHPATRRLLQGEIARQFRKDAPGRAQSSFAQMLKGWQRQLAWALPLFALVALGSWWLLDRPETKQLALGPTPKQVTAADESRASKSERLAPEPRPATRDPRPATVVETAPAEFSAARALPESPAAVPVQSLNQSAPDSANRAVPGKSRNQEQVSADGPAPEPLVVSPKVAAEQKMEPARGGSKEMVRADRLGAVASATPAMLAEATSANRLNTLPAAPTTDSVAALQSDRSLTAAYATKVSKPAEPLRNTPSTSAPLSRSEGLERERAKTYSQLFANQVLEPTKQKVTKDIPPAPLSPVLVNFRVEQTGRQLRVVDSDGSMYVGETDASPGVWAGGVDVSPERSSRSGVYVAGADDKKVQAVQLFKRDGKLNQLPAAAKSAPEPQLQSNFYRVAGTNRTLNQTVVFTWTFVELTNTALVAETGKIGGELNKDAAKLPTQFPAQLQNAFITGRAQFETGKEIEINAVPVSP